MKKILLGLVAIVALGGAGVYAYNAPSVPEDTGDYEVAYMETTPEGYEQLGLTEGVYEPREDALRTSGKEGSYEWWYVDTDFDDGTKVVAAFYTKYRFDINGPAHPTVQLDVDLPDGTNRKWFVSGEKGQLINASREMPDVKIRDSFLKYVDEDTYHIYFKEDDVEFDLILKRKVPMWRPDTGHIFFDQERESYIAWFPSVPAADATATLTLDGGETKELKGTGYHDRNWGNKFMAAAMNHWYWGRGTAGDYHIIMANLVSRAENGFSTVPIFYLAKDGELINGGSTGIEIDRGDHFTHEFTGKFYHPHQTYTRMGEDGTKYIVEYTFDHDLKAHRHLDDFPWWKAAIGRLMRVNSTYLRSVGELKVTIEKPNGEVEVSTGEAIWEQMFFGNNKEPIIWN